MSKHRITGLCLSFLIVCVLSGCQLAREDTGAVAGEDRLIGVLVTREHLDTLDTQASPEANWSVGTDGELTIDSVQTQNQGRLYATLERQRDQNEDAGESDEWDQHVFKGIDGISFFIARTEDNANPGTYYTTKPDDAVSDRMTKLDYKGEIYSLDLEGTIYITTEAGWNVIFLNPVYQSADGQVFAISADMGTSIGIYDNETNTRINQGEDNITQTMSETYTETVNGKAASYSTSVKLTIQEMYPPKKIAILQLDQNSAILSRAEYEPGKLPKAITPVRSAEYILVETHKAGPEGKTQVSRALFEKDKQALDTFYCREDGICVKQWTQLDWVK